MFKNIKVKAALWTFVIAFTVLGLLGLGSYLKNRESNDQDSSSDVLSATVNQVTVEVKQDENNTTGYQIEFNENESVYDLLLRLQSKNVGFTVVSQEFDFDGQKSYFITTLNGVSPDPASQFWKFQVNGIDSSVGISDYFVNNEDTITFVIDNITF